MYKKCVGLIKWGSSKGMTSQDLAGGGRSGVVGSPCGRKVSSRPRGRRVTVDLRSLFFFG